MFNLYRKLKENDHQVIRGMNEHSNAVRSHEEAVRELKKAMEKYVEDTNHPHKEND